MLFKIGMRLEFMTKSYLRKILYENIERKSIDQLIDRQKNGV